MRISRTNRETLEWLKQIEWKKMSHETLADEATRFFGALKTKRTKTIQTKMADFVQKEDQLRKCIFFKICKESGGEGVRGRAPPLSFKLKDVTLKEES